MTTTTGTSLILAALEKHGLARQPADWSETLSRVTEKEVRQQLRRPIAPFSFERLLAFLSPAAAGCLEEMAQAAHRVTKQRFGNTIQLYAPLYVSNYCINRCQYCGFNATHKQKRCRLSVEEAVAEAEIIAAEGFRDLLLVAGEDPQHVTVDYLSEIAKRLRGKFSAISIEIEPLTEEQYSALFAAGIEGVTLYQETYDPDVYARYHHGGPKANYANRILRQEAAACAGMRRLGIGALLGLSDWRYEAACVALHAHVLARHFWRSRVSVSFPRIRPAADVDRSVFPYLVDDRAFVQMLTALRLCFPDIGLVLSTRESAALRNHMLPLGVTQMSAGSKTNPGGYQDDSADAATRQFDISDERSVQEVVTYLRAQGYDPVWKDWDPGFLGTSDTVLPE